MTRVTSNNALHCKHNLWCYQLQEGWFVHMNHQRDLRIMLGRTTQMVPVLKKQFLRWRSQFLLYPHPWLKEQTVRRRIGTRNWWNYQAWIHPWIKHEDVVLSSLGSVLRLCQCQDGGANKLHHNIHNIRLIGTPQTAKTRCLQVAKPKLWGTS